MYSAVDVLLFEDDPDVVAQILGLLEVQGFQMHVARTLGEALDAMPQCTMLIAAPTIQQGKLSTSVVTEQWLGERRGPALMIPEAVDYEQTAAWLRTGISNVIRKPRKPEDIGTFTSVVLHLAGIVLDRCKTDKLYAQIETLEGDIAKLTAKIQKQNRLIFILSVLVGLLVLQAAPETKEWFTTTVWPFLIGLL